MTSIVKTLRIDDEILGGVDDIKRLYKEKLGFDFSVNNLLVGMILHGSEHYIQMLKIIGNGTCENKNGTTIESFADEIKEIEDYFDILKFTEES